MSMTRRHWLGAALAALASAFAGLSPAAARPASRRRPRPAKGAPPKTRWIGHY
jgi:hypothetical protein